MVEHLGPHLRKRVLAHDRSAYSAEVPEDRSGDRQYGVRDAARSTVLSAFGESFATASTTTPTSAGPANVAIVDALCSNTVTVTPRHRSRSNRTMPRGRLSESR